jgi:hypothetical protein
MKGIETVFNSVAVSILLSLSILLAIGVKNCNNLSPSVQSAPSGLRADGDPVPPFPPKPPSPNVGETVVIIADGDPVPPFPHPPLGSNSGVGESRHQAAREGQVPSA